MGLPYWFMPTTDGGMSPASYEEMLEAAAKEKAEAEAEATEVRS